MCAGVCVRAYICGNMCVRVLLIVCVWCVCLCVCVCVVVDGIKGGEVDICVGVFVCIYLWEYVCMCC